MPGLNVHADSENSSVATKKKWNRGPKVILAVSLLLLIPVVGTSLASNVVVNGGGPITFGQGYSGAIACSTPVDIKPDVQAFYDSTVTWSINSLTLSNINTTSTDGNGLGCGGKTITIQALNNGTVVGNPISFTLASASPWHSTNLANAYGFDSGHSATDSLTIAIPLEILATDVNGFTIQES